MPPETCWRIHSSCLVEPIWEVFQRQLVDLAPPTEAETIEVPGLLEDRFGCISCWPTHLRADAFCRAPMGLGHCGSVFIGCEAEKGSIATFGAHTHADHKYDYTFICAILRN